MPTPNNSTTGGYLVPTSQVLPLEGQELEDFIQSVIVGITGLNATLVRPAWQVDPPNIPAAKTCWCSFRIVDRPSDTFPFVGHIADGDGSNTLQRHERLNILASFFDTGSSGQADKYAALLRDGFSISQNTEQLQLNGFAFIFCDSPIPVPTLLKERWLYRADLPFQLRRAIVRTYPVESLQSAEIELNTQNPQLQQTIPIEE